VINNFSTPKELEQWGFAHLWELIDSIPEADPFSQLSASYIGVRAVKKASRRWDAEQLPFPHFLLMILKGDFHQAANEGKFTTAGEDAVALIQEATR
jgi:hypothetical protein